MSSSPAAPTDGVAPEPNHARRFTTIWLIASLIAVFIIGALAALGTNLSSEFAEVGAALK